ncbi:MAG: hypothetical protein H7Y89_07990 [Steroidobacteraceae bacterium]|nr:hypothetical protein [Steroidobacteraceae bacterium]
MIEPVLHDEQPHPIRRAAANLSYAHRFVSSLDEGAPEAITLSGLVASLDRCVRSLAKANHIEDLWVEARGLLKHAETIVKLRETATKSRRNALIPTMNAAHDALLEAAETLTNAKNIAIQL